MMEAEISSLPTAALPSVLSGDASTSVLASEPSVNGLGHEDQKVEKIESNSTKSCDGSRGVLMSKEDSVAAARSQPDEAVVHDSKQQNIGPQEPPVLMAMGVEIQNCETFQDREVVRILEVEDKRENDEEKELKKDDDEDEEEEEADGRSLSVKKNERPKRDVQRRSVFEMLQSEIDDEEDAQVDNAAVENVENKASECRDGGRKKRKIRDDESELNLDDLNDDDDEDFTADSHQKKSSTKKKPSVVKKEEKTLILFDDDDLPLKGKRSGGRPKKKKLEEEEVPSEDEWAMTGRIKGKLFQDDEDDNENDIDFNDCSFRQQSSSEKKILTSSNKRILEGNPKKQSCSKKIKIDVQGWKFSKPRDGMEAKPKSRISSGPSTQHAPGGHHGCGTSDAGARRQAVEDGRTGSSGRPDDRLRQKESILTIWDQKLRHLDRELEERVAIIRRNEGRILREERRLKEYEAVLTYREKLLSNCEEFVASSNVDEVAEKLTCVRKDYEKYRRLAEEHKHWIEKEHQKIEACASNKVGSNGIKTGELPSTDADGAGKPDCPPERLNLDMVASDPLIIGAATPPEEVKVDG